MSRWTEADYRRVVKAATKAPKPSKYKNQKTVVDNIVFDSKKEAQRYHELKLMEKAGLIKSLTCQPSYALKVQDTVVGYYRADFSYFDVTGMAIVEDVKGVKTPVYRLKKKLVEAIYDFQIRET